MKRMLIVADEPSDAAELSATPLVTAPADAAPARRVSDRSENSGAPLDATGAAEHLLKRREALDEALRHQEASPTAGILQRSSPSPAALLMIEERATGDRFAKLLGNANIEIDRADDASDALLRLQNRVHALMFTDSLELVQSARQLELGAATHIVFVDGSGGARSSEALRVGANDCMPSEARGEYFWSHLTIARRIADLAASLQLALTDNRILSTIDELTRAGSRRFFEHQFPREVQRAARSRRSLAIVMCDIDHFKRINDRYGHQTGDEVLTEFSDRITHGLRREDWVARIGGEEFAVVLPEAGDAEARAIAQRLCDCVSAKAFITSSQVVAVTASFGVCALDAQRVDARGLSEALVRAADAALYQSKRDGRNRVTTASFRAVDRVPTRTTSDEG